MPDGAVMWMVVQHPMELFRDSVEKVESFERWFDWIFQVHSCACLFQVPRCLVCSSQEPACLGRVLMQLEVRPSFCTPFAVHSYGVFF